MLCFLIATMLSVMSSLYGQSEVYLLGDSSRNEFLKVKAYDGQLYAAGRVFIDQDTFGTFSEIDPNTGQVLWARRLNTQSSFLDFLKDDNGGFLVVGRTEGVGTTQNPQNNSSVLSRFFSNGGLDYTKVYSMDSEGRESFNHIIRNTNPGNSSFPYYICGYVNTTSDNNPTPPNPRDDVILVTTDEQGNIGLNRRVSRTTNPDNASQNWDTEMAGGYLEFQDNTGRVLTFGNIYRGNNLNNDNRAAIAVFDNLGNVLQVLEEDQPRLQGRVFDVKINNNNEFVFLIGNQNSVSLLKTDAVFNRIWSYRLQGVAWGEGLMLKGDEYYALIEDPGGYYSVLHILDNGNTASLNWSRTLNDQDMIQLSALPFLIELNSNQFAYVDSRIPASSGNGVAAGIGQEDILLAITDSLLSSCVTVEITNYSLVLDSIGLVNDTLFLGTIQDTFFVDSISLALDYLSLPACQSICGALLIDSTDVLCSDPLGYSYNFQFQNNLDLEITSVIVQDVTPGFTINPKYWNFFGDPIPPLGTSPVVDLEIIPDVPLTDSTELCIEFIYLAEDSICCRFEQCITLGPIDPCGSVSAAPLDTEEDCCYELLLTNDFCPDFFTGIQTELLTDGLVFTGLDGNADWSATPGGGGTVVNWTHTNGTLPLGVLDNIGFCFSDPVSVNQSPQQVAVHWLGIDPLTGEPGILCSDTLEFLCDPCLTITGEAFCDDSGNIIYDFDLTNNESGISGTLIYFESRTPDVVFDPALIDVSLGPGNTHSGQIQIINNAGLLPGSIVEFKVVLFDDEDYCCQIRDVTFEIPDCDQPLACECDSLDAFVGDVNAGFGSSVDCAGSGPFFASFSPAALRPCDSVRWSYANLDNGRSGNFPHVEGVGFFELPEFGRYQICMKVTRRDEEGNECFDPVEYCEEKTLFCLAPDPNHDGIYFSSAGEKSVWASLDKSLPVEILRYTLTSKDGGRTRLLGMGKDIQGLHARGCLGGNLQPRWATDQLIAHTADGVQIKLGQGVQAVDREAVPALRLYPNPAGQVLNVEFPSEGTYRVEIVDTHGRTFPMGEWSLDAGGVRAIGISTLAPGFYVLRAIEADGRMYTRKFLKE